jgi:2-C-methyl-D-erythritol 4-phosphate cytidylyltransferase
MSCTVIIPAAGSGLRFGGDLPKQFALLNGRPIILHAIERFFRLPCVEHVVICVAPQHQARLVSLIDSSLSSKVTVTLGGATRQQSVRLGLDEALKQGSRFVAVHDAVRPFFTRVRFEKLLAHAEETGAAIPAIPVKNTIHVIASGEIQSTPDRTGLYAAQTPQIFLTELLLETLNRAAKEQFDATDEAGLVARYGHRVRIVEGDPRNLKITRPEDLVLAEWIASTWEEL